MKFTEPENLPINFDEDEFEIETDELPEEEFIPEEIDL